MDEDELQRARRADPDRSPESDPGPTDFPGRVTSTTGLAVGNYILMQPFTVVGAPHEGGTATLTDTGPPVPVLWIGPKTPATGDLAVVRRCGNRWVAEKKAGGGGSDTTGLPGCACTTIPTTLHMAGVSTGSCFDGTTHEPVSCCTGYPDCTFTYGPTPPEFSGLDLGPNCFLSEETFTDFLGASYRLNLGCDSIFFRLSRVYEPSDVGDAFHDATIYAWSIGSFGCTCSPFLLTGHSIGGGDFGCVLTVTE